MIDYVKNLQVHPNWFVPLSLRTHGLFAEISIYILSLTERNCDRAKIQNINSILIDITIFQKMVEYTHLVRHNSNT